MDRAVYRGLLLFSGTALALWAFTLILLPFIVPIAWALCLFAVTARAYRYLAARSRRPRLVALGMVTLTGALVLGPLIYVAAVFIDQARQVDFSPTIDKLKAEAPEALARIDTILAYLEEAQSGERAVIPTTDGDAPPAPVGTAEGFVKRAQKNLPRIASSVLGLSLEGAVGFLMTPFFFLFGLVMTLVTLFFLYRGSTALRSMCMELSPLSEEDTGRVLHTLHGATVSAIVGGLVVALVQGMLGTFMFWVAGIQSPVMWGVVMAALSLLPFGGTAFVWAPAGIILLATGQPGAGWFVLIFGAVIVAGADNVLRPVILSKMGGGDVEIHPLLLFFAILSGIGLFGISGIVFGPLMIALLTTMVRIYREHGPAKAATPDTDPAPQAL